MQSRNMYLVKVFVCTVIVAFFVLNQPIEAQETVCGPVLYEILKDLCIGFQRMTLPTKKRAERFGLDMNALVPVPRERSSLIDPMYGEIGNFMTKTRRRRHGIYYECCDKGCTYNEIASYCEDTNKNSKYYV